MTTRHLLSIAAVAGLACTAAAQDSVSTTGTGPLPGDALDAYAADSQVVSYVVDLAPFNSKLGGSFGVAPIAKASQGAGFPTHLTSAQAISSDIVAGGSLFDTNYPLWDFAGAGVNPIQNVGGASIDSDANTRLAAAFAEFGGPAENVVTSEITYNSANPGRLFVTRVMAAQNTIALTSQSFSGLAIGTVDADLNTYMRSDDFGSCCVTGNNIFSVAAASRTNVSNLIQGNPIGGADAAATSNLISGFGDVLTTPQNVPASLGGPAYFGASFDGNLRHGTPGSISTSFNWSSNPGTSGTRGAPGFGQGDFFGAGVGTAAMLEKSIDAGNDTDAADQIIAWGVNADGSPSSALNTYAAPSLITDNSDSTMLPFQTFNNYGSQTAFQGGTGQVAVGTDADGNLLLAAAFNQFFDYFGGSQNTPDNAMAVARVDASTGAVEWTMAAYYDIAMATGKGIFDAAGVQCGELAALGSIPGAPTGPNSSSPAFDSAGNLYFTHAYLDYGDDLTPMTDDDRTRTGLFRSVYNADTFSYDLDLMLEFGGSAEPIMGQNSNRQYRIDFVSIADSNSTSSGTMFSSNVTGSAFPGAPAQMAAGDERALGGLVFAANILYDSNDDGIFNDGFSTTDPVDEEYNALIYVHPIVESSIIDCNSNGVDDADDIANGTSNDANGNGIPDECDSSTRLCGDVNANGSIEPSDFTAWLGFFNNPGAPLAYRGDTNNDGSLAPNDFTTWLGFFNNPASDPADCLD